MNSSSNDDVVVSYSLNKSQSEDIQQPLALLENEQKPPDFRDIFSFQSIGIEIAQIQSMIEKIDEQNLTIQDQTNKLEAQSVKIE